MNENFPHKQLDDGLRHRKQADKQHQICTENNTKRNLQVNLY